ncbi:hypothetical protein DFH06DRAFT_1237823 [Mycena polygramma]|nr:hypothetical protein DFH06DRAFT_1237823 [Mycena polygramma]
MYLLSTAAAWIADESEPTGDWYTIIKRWVSHAFTATVNWMRDVAYPTVAAGIVDALQLLKTHPHAALGISASIFLVPEILLLPLSILRSIFLLFLRIIGFGKRGVVRGPLNKHRSFLPAYKLSSLPSPLASITGSPAARYQSQHYGGYTPASPALFAKWESAGMVYEPAVKPSGAGRAIIRSGAGLVFVYVVLGMNGLW